VGSEVNCFFCGNFSNLRAQSENFWLCVTFGGFSDQGSGILWCGAAVFERVKFICFGLGLGYERGLMNRQMEMLKLLIRGLAQD